MAKKKPLTHIKLLRDFPPFPVDYAIIHKPKDTVFEDGECTMEIGGTFPSKMHDNDSLNISNTITFKPDIIG